MMDCLKYYFTNRVVPIWNSLPNSVVCADSTNLFKSRLDKFWKSYDFVCDYIKLSHLPPKVRSNFSLHK